MGATEELAAWVAGSRYDDLPVEAVHEAKRAMVNFCAVSIAGAKHPAVDRTLAVTREVGGQPMCAVLGRRERTDPLHAALLNGIASHVLDFDDTHPATILHPSGPVLPPVLALAEWRGGNGQDLLLAFVVGVEVACRAGLAVFPEHYDLGSHITGTAGSIGAAAASARYIALDGARTVYALGLGATQGAGVQEMFGSMAKSFHPGRAAQSGLLAGLLAEQEYTATATALEGARGWCRTSSPAAHPERLTADLGSTWEICRNTYKPFACGVVVHPAIDGMLRMRRRRAIRPQDVESIDVQVHPRVLRICGCQEPSVGLEGKFSIYHCAAVALVDGGAGEAQFSDERVRDPIVAGLRRRVRAHADADLSPEQAVVRVRLSDGSVLEQRVEQALGTLGNPMSDEDLSAKFEALVEPVLGAAQTARLLAHVWQLDRTASLQELFTCCVPTD